MDCRPSGVDLDVYRHLCKLFVNSLKHVWTLIYLLTYTVLASLMFCSNFTTSGIKEEEGYPMLQRPDLVVNFSLAYPIHEDQILAPNTKTNNYLPHKALQSKLITKWYAMEGT